MSAGDARQWPYGAILPWTESRSIWHAWGSQMPAALAEASEALGDASLADAAVKDSAVFTPTLLTAGGPDNGWNPTPTDRVQIAYGVDSRVQSLLAVADATGSRGFADLAAMQAAWFFGANRVGCADVRPCDRCRATTACEPDGSGEPQQRRREHDPRAPDDDRARLPPGARRPGRDRDERRRDRRASGRCRRSPRSPPTERSSTPEESWTGESSWAGDTLTLARGQSATFDIGTDDIRRWVEPVVWSEARRSQRLDMAIGQAADRRAGGEGPRAGHLADPRRAAAALAAAAGAR